MRPPNTLTANTLSKLQIALKFISRYNFGIASMLLFLHEIFFYEPSALISHSLIPQPRPVSLSCSCPETRFDVSSAEADQAPILAYVAQYKSNSEGRVYCFSGGMCEAWRLPSIVKHFAIYQTLIFILSYNVSTSFPSTTFVAAFQMNIVNNIVFDIHCQREHWCLFMPQTGTSVPAASVPNPSLQKGEQDRSSRHLQLLLLSSMHAFSSRLQSNLDQGCHKVAEGTSQT